MVNNNKEILKEIYDMNNHLLDADNNTPWSGCVCLKQPKEINPNIGGKNNYELLEQQNQ